jgi:hypothetical protein
MIAYGMLAIRFWAIKTNPRWVALETVSPWYARWASVAAKARVERRFVNRHDPPWLRFFFWSPWQTEWFMQCSRYSVDR